jgi:hypothetical protein
VFFVQIRRQLSIYFFFLFEFLSSLKHQHQSLLFCRYCVLNVFLPQFTNRFIAFDRLKFLAFGKILIHKMGCGYVYEGLRLFVEVDDAIR